eukprot:1797400-Amphidinium_carterae.1
MEATIVWPDVTVEVAKLLPGPNGFLVAKNITTQLPNSLSTDVVPEPADVVPEPTEEPTDVVPEPIPSTPLPPTPLPPTTPGPVNELCNQIYMAASPYPASPESRGGCDVAALQQQLLQLIKQVYPDMQAPLDLDATSSEEDVPLGQLFGLSEQS